MQYKHRMTDAQPLQILFEEIADYLEVRMMQKDEGKRKDALQMFIMKKLFGKVICSIAG